MRIPPGMKIAEKISRAFRTLSLRFSTPLRIEFNVTDYCNLNCKGCTHYASIAPKEFEKPEILCEEMMHLSMIKGAEKLRDIYLIGGEPLLYPYLEYAIISARRYFPWAEISIFTNGLLIPKMSDNFWELCRVNNILIVMTRYPVKVDYGNLSEICEKHGVRHKFFGDRGEENSFFKVRLNSAKTENRWLSHFKCYSFGCITAHHGKLFPCPQCGCIENLNRKFGTNFRQDEGDYLTITEIKNVRQIMRLRSFPIPFCGYCQKSQIVPYGTSMRTIDEWTDQNSQER